MICYIAVAIDRDTPVNNAFIGVIDRDMISQSVLSTHHASIFPAKGTRVVKMAARIEAGASFTKWEKWNKTLENFKSSHQVEFSVLCSKNVDSANGRLSSKVVHHQYDHKYAHAQYGQRGYPKFRTSPQSTEIRGIQNRLLSPYTKYPMKLTPTTDRVTLTIIHHHPQLTGSSCQ